MNRGAAFVLLALAGMAGWWNVLGPSLLWGLPMVACAGLVVARRLRPLAGAGALALWVPLSLLLAGLPLHALRPNGWDDAVDSLSEGLGAIGTAGGGRLFDEPWALAAGLLALGVCWMSAALLTTRGTLLPFAGLLVLLEPLITSVLYQSSAVNTA